MEDYLLQITHIILGIVLFFIINWIGKHSFSVGYMQISVFVKDDNAPAFNVLVRILSPVVYILIISVILYKLNLDSFVKNIYMISIYYLVFRLVFNLITNRGLLINWGRQIFYWCSIVLSSFYVYKELIIEKKNLFPDLSTWTNQIWIIVLIFIYSVFNRISLSQKGTIRRKNRYLENRYGKFNTKYGIYIDENIDNIKLKMIAYAIMIYEDFNRPRIVRFLENIAHLITRKEHTLGLMQVKTKSLIKDKQSVELGIRKIVNKYLELIEYQKVKTVENEEERKERKNKLFVESGIVIPESSYKYEPSDWEVSEGIIKDYNPDYNYINEVQELSEILIKKYYPDSETTLIE
ncbi:hypothetical protein [Carboxylicivirga marina]|uniref:Uncharacterized protein n=1 Tax=Carboxylicivirga marina TaxID=2800988 RepID=A0ABS1HPK9_9BACT|nr:hypothetical protein [Carboxylicivirga marina]MBK3519621.1 hypothetical protein [Carboxylicivirga marina]